MNRAVAEKLMRWVDPLEPAIPALYQPRATGLDDPWELLLAARAGARARSCLLVGASGSGKSTELSRLAEHRMRQEGAPEVVLLRLQDQSTPEQLSAAQVLFLLGVAALKSSGVRPPSERIKSLENAYKEIIAGHDADRGGVNVAEILDRLSVGTAGLLAAAGLPVASAAVAGGAQVLSALRAPRHLPLPGRGIALSANDPPVTRLAEAVNICFVWASETLRRPVELFVDGLDKLDMSSVDSMFGSGVLSLAEAPVVYTAPIAIRYNAAGNSLDKYFDLLDVGNFAIFDRKPDGSHSRAGFDKMRRLLSLRMKLAGVTPEEVFEDGLRQNGLADRMIEASGGLPHLLIQLLDKALRLGCLEGAAGRSQLGKEEVDASIRDLERRYVLRLDPEHVESVIESWSTQRKPRADSADVLLYNNLVLCYPNGFHWFRPSPLLLGWLREEFADRCPPRGA